MAKSSGRRLPGGKMSNPGHQGGGSLPKPKTFTHIVAHPGKIVKKKDPLPPKVHSSGSPSPPHSGGRLPGK